MNEAYKNMFHILKQLTNSKNINVKEILNQLRTPDSNYRYDLYNTSLWNLVMNNLDIDQLSTNGEPSYMERAIIDCLKIYAITQSGSQKTNSLLDNQNNQLAGSFKIEFFNEKYVIKYTSQLNQDFHYESFSSLKEVEEQLKVWESNLKPLKATQKSMLNNMGKTLGQLRKNQTNSDPLDDRFNSMISSIDYNRFIYNLTSLIRLNKSKSNQSIDFSLLAQDLFDFQLNSKKRQSIKLKWSQAYYLQ